MTFSKAIRSSLLIVGALTITMTGCGSENGSTSSSEETSSAPENFTADITLISSTPASLAYVAGGECGGMGNDAMKEGKPYRIEAKGETIALGELPAGVGVNNAGRIDCHFNFEVDLPSGLGFYTVDMGEFQGTAEFSEDDLATGVKVDRVDLENRK